MSNTEDRFLSKEYPSTSSIRADLKEKKMNQYVVFIRDEKGKLIETERIEAVDIHGAIEQTNGVYDVIKKEGE